MKQLPPFFKRGRWTYTLLTRRGSLALLRVDGAQHPSFEVIRVQTCSETRWPDGRVTPARETMPRTSDWGTRGWTYTDLLSAGAALAGRCS